MPTKKKSSPLYILVVAPVVATILGALILAGAGVLENIRFANSVQRIVGLMTKVKILADRQEVFALAEGDDVWNFLIRKGELPTSTIRVNAWGGEIKALAGPEETIRIETVLPAVDCRRTALHFIKRRPSDLGIVSIEAKPRGIETWTAFFPGEDLETSPSPAETACGRARQSELAFVIKTK